MSLYDSLSQSAEINQKHMAIINSRSCQNKVVGVIAQRDDIVFFSLLILEGLNCVLNLHSKKVHNKNFVEECNDNFILPDADWLDARLKGYICHYSLSIYWTDNKQITVIKYGKFLGGSKRSFSEPDQGQ